jgi:hypothetical protein
MMQLYDGSQYWGEWCCGVRHGWGVLRTIDGHSEYRGEFRNGAYCGLGVMRQGGVSKCGHWVEGELVLRQRLSASALFAARDAAIRAGLIRRFCVCGRSVPVLFISVLHFCTQDPLPSAAFLMKHAPQPRPSYALF